MFTKDQKDIVIIIVVCTLLILLLISFIALIISRYQKNRVQYFKEIGDMENLYQVNLMQTQVAIQEQTFMNISREIHDNLGQKLSLAKLQLNKLLIETNVEGQIQLNTAVEIISEVLNDLRDLSRSLSSDLLIQNGLIHAIDQEIVMMNRSGLYKIEFDISGEHVFLSEENELVLFRIFQEALHNIVKHANASSIHIQVSFEPLRFDLVIKDNGIGFDTASEIVGSGLKNIQDRVKLIGGNFSILTNFNEGTQLTIEIPLYDSKKSI